MGKGLNIQGLMLFFFSAPQKAQFQMIDLVLHFATRPVINSCFSLLLRYRPHRR